MTLKPITAKQAETAVTMHDIKWVMVHRCTICQTPCGYSFENGCPEYHSHCGCVTHNTPPQPRPWSAVADLINIQSNDDVRKTFAAKFGMNPDGTPLP